MSLSSSVTRAIALGVALAAFAVAVAAGARSKGSHALTIEDVRAWAGRLHPLGEEVPQAVAVSVREDGHGVAGFASGYEHPTQALMEALAQCEKERGDFAGTGVCKPFSIGKKIVFDFGDDPKGPAEPASEACLERGDVEFYRLDMWIRVFRAAELSYQDSYAAEFEVRLAPDGSLQAARLTHSESPEFDPWAQRILETAGPFGPLFGELSCLGGAAFPFRFSDPRKPSAGAL
ncbi:MAG: hypothetical protein ACR2PQ_04915 [Myxococcota bacterium]